MADHERSIGGEFIGSLGSDIAIKAEEIDGAASRIEQKTAMHRWERMQTEFKRGDDT